MSATTSGAAAIVLCAALAGGPIAAAQGLAARAPARAEEPSAAAACLEIAPEIKRRERARAQAPDRSSEAVRKGLEEDFALFKADPRTPAAFACLSRLLAAGTLRTPSE